jgi:hypothetical protein
LRGPLAVTAGFAAESLQEQKESLPEQKESLPEQKKRG